MSKLYVDELEPKTSSNKKITSSKHLSGKVVHCWIYPTSNQTIATSSATFVEFHATHIDTHGMADIDDNAIVIGTGLGGYYHIRGCVRNNSWTAPRQSIQIFVNGSIKVYNEDSNGSAHTGEYPHTVIDSMLYLEEGDSVKLKLFHNFGSSKTTYSLAGSHAEAYMQSHLWLYRIGD